ncbi:MAG: hypothetical protein Q9209_007115 [Squamulea sp. 1 TL-2023]
MRFLTLVLLLSTATAIPISKGKTRPTLAFKVNAVKHKLAVRSPGGETQDAGDRVRKSWSARNIENRVPDADEMVRNSWSE